jgi:hypothetical protein
MIFLTSTGLSSTLYLPTVITPLSGFKKLVNMRSVVVFPAPFGPRRPVISPSRMLKEMLLTAVMSPNFLVIPCAVIM